MPAFSICRTFTARLLALCALLCGALLGSSSATSQAQQPALPEKASRPNIVIILADDLGYGDLGSYNPDSKIPTPQLDRLAAQGLRFTDAHSPSAVCSPTRYGLLTGRYAWRSRLQQNVLRPWDPPLIAAERLTLPALLAEAGYRTACVGKWHLGWDWPTRDGQRPANGPDNLSNVDFTQPIKNGPTTRGFQSYFGTDVPNYPPFCFVENDRTVGIPSVAFGPRSGPALPGWDWHNVLPELGNRAVRFLEESAQNRAQPFFLYLPLTSPHYPVVPNPAFRGQSQAGEYGDFVVETDAIVGQVLESLKKLDLERNTLVIFTSDNGPEVAGEVTPGAYARIQQSGHASMGRLRGVKRDLWEGGHRVPFVVRWPGVVPAGQTNSATICHVDLFATAAELVARKLPPNAGEDSVSLLPLFSGTATAAPVRENTVLHSGNGRFAIRQHEWVLLLAPSGDCNRDAEPNWFREQRGYTAHTQPGELFNLADDPSQKRNLYAEQPERVRALRAVLEKLVADGRSTPGPTQANDVPVRIDGPVALPKKKS